MNRLLAPYAVPQERRPSRAALVPGIRPAVDQWRAQSYHGATDTTKRLLQYWFQQDHKVRRETRPQEFGYYFCQREAMETLIYLYEVRQLRSLYDLSRSFPPERPFLIRPDEDRFARYVFKMATGSGKTKVMSLAVVWSYFNAIFEPNSTLPRTFLVIAPNVIVYERLEVDFADGRIFDEDPTADNLADALALILEHACDGDFVTEIMVHRTATKTRDITKDILTRLVERWDYLDNPNYPRLFDCALAPDPDAIRIEQEQDAKDDRDHIEIERRNRT